MTFENLKRQSNKGKEIPSAECVELEIGLRKKNLFACCLKRIFIVRSHLLVRIVKSIWN